MIEGYQLSLFEPEKLEDVRKMDNDIRNLIRKMGRKFGLNSEEYSKIDPKIVVSPMILTYWGEPSSCVKGDYILFNSSDVGNRRAYAEESMHFLRQSIFHGRVLRYGGEVVEEFFGGLGALLFSNRRKLITGRGGLSLSELSRAVDDVAEEDRWDPTDAIEFKKDYMTHQIGYRLAEFFYKRGLLTKYPNVFRMHPLLIIGMFEEEGASEEIRTFVDVYVKPARRNL